MTPGEPTCPSRWSVLRNKNLLAESLSTSKDGSEELLSVSHLTGVTPRSEKTVNMFEAENLTGYRLVEPGDLVINTMWAWMGALGVSRHSGLVSPAYGVYRPRPGAPFDGRYFDYVYRSTPYVDLMTNHSRGIWSSRLRLYPEVFLRLPVNVPSLEEQRAIADYLDRETAQIDTLIAKQEELIATLRERRTGIIRASVSGIHASGPRVNYNEWFGSLPVHWRTAPIRYDFSVVLGKMLNSTRQDSDSDVQAPYLAAGSIQADNLLLDESKTMNFSADELVRYSLRASDVVVVEGGASYGRSHHLRADLEGWGFQNHVARLRSSTGRVTGEFVTYCLKACLATGYIEANNRTATLPSLSREVLGALRVPIPPHDEQREIVSHLDEQTSKIDALVAKAERFIGLSKERRAALITAAVTGQIDVRASA